MSEKAEWSVWLRERAGAFNLLYIKNDLLACADRIEHLQSELAQAKEQLAAREAKLEVLYKFSADDVLYNFDNPSPNCWYKHTNKVYGEVLREILAADEHSTLREHEAKVLEEAASHFDGGVWNLIDGGEFISRENPVKQLRRMAQERR